MLIHYHAKITTAPNAGYLIFAKSIFVLKKMHFMIKIYSCYIYNTSNVKQQITKISVTLPNYFQKHM